MNVFVQKTRSKSLERTCLISTSLARNLKIKPGKKYTLTMGHRKAKAQFVIDGEGEQVLSLSRDVFDQLLAYTDLQTSIQVTRGRVRLGPVVGVFVSPRFLEDIAQQQPPDSAREIVRANNWANTFLYYFTIDRTNWLRGCLKGYVYLKQYEKWYRYWVPLPDVVYDRGVNFTKEEKLLVKHFRQQWEESEGKIVRINSRDSLSKWLTHQALLNEPQVTNLLPRTEPFQDMFRLRQMIDHCDSVFLKTFHGNLGRQVVKVCKLSSGGFEYTYNRWGNIRKGSLASSDKLEAFIDSFLGTKNFVIQEEVSLLKMNGRPLDLRVLVQKNGRGTWRVTIIEVRLGSAGSPTTNIASGGDLSYFSEVFPTLLGHNKAKKLRENIENSAVQLAGAIERQLGPFGEIGLDLAIDKDLKIWFLEANSKPDKDPEPWATDGKSLAFFNVLDYAKYLAGFGSG